MVPRPSTGCQWLLERTLLVLPQKEMELAEEGKGVSEGLTPEGVKRGGTTQMLHSQANR